MTLTLDMNFSEKFRRIGLPKLAERTEKILQEMEAKLSFHRLYDKVMLEMENWLRSSFHSFDNFRFYERRVLQSLDDPKKFSKKELNEIDRNFFKQVTIGFHNGRQPQSGNLLELSDQREILDITHPFKIRTFGINEAGHDNHRDSGWHIRFEDGYSGFYKPVSQPEKNYCYGFLKLERYNDGIEIIDRKIIR